MPYTIEVEPAEYLWIDLFPADITKPDGEVMGEVRVIVTNDRMYVLDDMVEGPQVVLSEPLTEFGGSHKEGYTVATEEGTYAFSRSPKCGCGSRVRGVQPFPGVPFVARKLRK